MKKLFTPVLSALAALILFSGCVAAVGNRGGLAPCGNATLGQQLLDLQKARDAGALSDAEYQTQRAKLLGEK